MAKFKLFARESSAPKNQAAIIMSFARIIGRKPIPNSSFEIISKPNELCCNANMATI